MRLIDADALDWERIEHKHGARHEAVVDCEQMVEIAQTIDAVPVVRCKDCKWKADTIGDSWCDFHEFTVLSDDDFCSYGERKDDE